LISSPSPSTPCKPAFSTSSTRMCKERQIRREKVPVDLILCAALLLLSVWVGFPSTCPYSDPWTSNYRRGGLPTIDVVVRLKNERFVLENLVLIVAIQQLRCVLYASQWRQNRGGVWGKKIKGPERIVLLQTISCISVTDVLLLHLLPRSAKLFQCIWDKNQDATRQRDHRSRSDGTAVEHSSCFVSGDLPIHSQRDNLT